jgi:hypothetical protein
MINLLRLLCAALIGLLRCSTRREAEILVLRHQLNVLKRQAPKRPNLRNLDRLLFVWLSRLVPTTLGALKVVGPETVIRWQRAGFRAYWRFKSRVRAGRPKTPLEIRQLIREMSIANPLWGAPRIHGNNAPVSRQEIVSSDLAGRATALSNFHPGCSCVYRKPHPY